MFTGSGGKGTRRRGIVYVLKRVFCSIYKILLKIHFKTSLTKLWTFKDNFSRHTVHLNNLIVEQLRQVCVQLPTPAVNVALPAFAATAPLLLGA